MSGAECERVMSTDAYCKKRQPSFSDCEPSVKFNIILLKMVKKERK